MLGVERKLKSADREFVFELNEKLIQRYENNFGFEVNRYEQDKDWQYKNAACYPGKTAFLADTLKVLPYFCYPELWDRKGVFFYVDPPYLLDSRKDNRPVYKHELSDEQHRDLIQQLSLFQSADIAISCYPNEMYQDWFWDHEHPREWRMIEFQSTTRHGMATEQLWMNYPPPKELHDYRYLGGDFRERERITRQKKRLLNKFKKLSPLEQAGLSQAMQDHLCPPEPLEKERILNKLRK